MKDHRISVMSVPVSNPDASKAFYTDKLGFTVVMDERFGGGLRWCMLRPPAQGGTSITLVTWFDTMPPGSLKGSVISVPDIEAAATELREKGVLSEDDEIESAPWGRWVTVDDPDGNSWVVQQDAEGIIDFS